MNDFSDKEFVAGCMRGERQVIDALVDAYYPTVFSLCIKILESRDEAKDITQDTFVRVFDKLSQFRYKSSLKTWILSISYNLCINRLKVSKYKSHMSLDSDLEVPEDITHAEEALLNGQKIEVIEQALLLLGMEEKLLIEMYYLNECSIKDIALILDKSETATKTGLFRARQKLKILVLNKNNHECN